MPFLKFFSQILLFSSNEEDVALPDAYMDDLDAPVVTVTVSPTNDHNYYNRNPSPHHVYQVINADDMTVVEETEMETEESIEDEAAVEKSLSKKVQVVEEDSNDEGMRGAEALLNLASAKQPISRPSTSDRREAVLKKIKIEES